MKHYRPSRPTFFRRPPKVIPLFHAVPLRARADGWTPLRQAEFIGMLAQTRSVAAAARFVGMGRESAYRLRGRAGSASFCAAWDAALGKGLDQPPPTAHHATRKSTLAELQWRVETGLWQVLMRGGRYVGVRRKSDNSALLMLARRADAFECRNVEHTR